jgi:hypothetical protein
LFASPTFFGFYERPFLVHALNNSVLQSCRGCDLLTTLPADAYGISINGKNFIDALPVFVFLVDLEFDISH